MSMRFTTATEGQGFHLSPWMMTSTNPPANTKLGAYSLQAMEAHDVKAVGIFSDRAEKRKASSFIVDDVPERDT